MLENGSFNSNFIQVVPQVKECQTCHKCETCCTCKKCPCCKRKFDSYDYSQYSITAGLSQTTKPYQAYYGENQCNVGGAYTEAVN